MTTKSETALAGAARNGEDDVDILPLHAAPANPLDCPVDRYADAHGRKAMERPTMRAALERIRSGVDADAIQRCREARDRDGADAYRDAKKHLTAFTFAGTFTRRKADKLESHSGVVVLDFDHLDDLTECRARVERDSCVVFCFVSPGGDGLKVGVRVPDLEHHGEHRDFWLVAADYAAREWGLEADKSGKDVSRLCFTSADPHLYMNEAATVLPAPEPDTPDDDELGILSFNADADYGDYANDRVEVPTSRKDADKARAALARLAQWRVDDYNAWLNVGMILKAAGCSCSEWEQWSRQSAKCKPGECAEKWEGFQSDGLKVGSLVMWARIDNGEPATLAEAGAFEGSEVWFAQLVAKQHGDNLKHVWPWRSWMGWDANAGHWHKDESGCAWAAAKLTLKKLVASAAKAAGTDAGKEALERASKFMRANALKNALTLAASESNVVALPSEWDAAPYLLNCANGTVDLRDGTLREHRRDDRLTKSTGVAVAGDAPLWRTFLERIVPDADVRSYLQRAVGYSAIGSVTEHVLHIAWGGGANGKSVFFNAITHALGDYSATVPGTLLVSDGAREHPTVVASLHGVRFALASESEEDGRIRPAQLKQLTGGDELTARRMREDFWSFKPSHTLWLQTNHKPQANDATHGFWRRVRLIPFTVTIPAEEQDKHLTAKLYEEAGGILRWIIEGAQQYLTDGLEPPEAITAATAEYQHEEDELAEFVECVGLVADESAFTATKALYAIYEKWADGGAFKPWKPRTFSRKLDSRYTSHKREGVRGFRVKLE